MRRSVGFASLVVVCAVALSGCAGSAATSASASITPYPQASPSDGPSSVPTRPPLLSPPPHGLVIYHESPAQFEILLSSGRRILIDIWNPDALSSPVTATDILLTSHTHSDHYEPQFVDEFPGRKLSFEKGTLEVDGIKIESLPALHNEGDEYLDRDGSNYIHVIEVDGWRLAHFGDLGQDRITDWQMARLAKIDIAMSQIGNPLSEMDEVNRKGFNQMDQLAARMMIATHDTEATAGVAAQVWQTAWAPGPITVTRDGLPARFTCLFMGEYAAPYADKFGIPGYAA